MAIGGTDYSRVMYLRSVNSGDVQSARVISETRMSYVTAHGKYAKREYTVVTKQDYDDCMWGHKHRYRIQSMLNNRRKVSGATLRAVAALVGYQVAPDATE